MNIQTYLMLPLWITATLTIQAMVPRTFYNDTDHKVRLSMWYKRYDMVDGEIRFAKHKHKYTTDIKSGETARITLRPRHHQDLKVYCFMATNTRRRNDWAGLTYKEIQDQHDFIIVYDENDHLIITPSARNVT